MRIGIAAPIELMSLKEHLPNATAAELKLGLGGTAINILVDGFIKSGHTVTVFTLDRTVKERIIVSGNNLKIIIGHTRSNWLKQMIDFHRLEYQQIKNFILSEQSNLDIVNAHWSYEYAIGTILARVPHLITFRDHAQSILKLSKHPFRVTRLLMDKWVRRNGCHFSFNSHYLKDLIGVNGSVVPNPIKDSIITRARRFPVNPEYAKLCFIANGWNDRKNPETAIDAFLIIKREFKHAELHFIGHGFESPGAMSEQLCRNGKLEGLVFRGPMTHLMVLQELNHFDIMLHTAREESFGNNLIEAMAKGIPVVAGKNAGAVPWVLNNGAAGCLTDVEDPETIAKDVKRLLVDSEYYEQLSKNGIENLRNRFSQIKVCAAYTTEFQKVLLGSR